MKGYKERLFNMTSPLFKQQNVKQQFNAKLVFIWEVQAL